MKETHKIPDIDDVNNLVETVEDKMNKIANAIRGIDKRMSYNCRLMQSVVMDEDQFIKTTTQANAQDRNNDELNVP